MVLLIKLSIYLKKIQLRSKIKTFGIKGAWVQFFSLTMQLISCTALIIHSFQKLKDSVG